MFENLYPVHFAMPAARRRGCVLLAALALLVAPSLARAQERPLGTPGAAGGGAEDSVLGGPGDKPAFDSSMPGNPGAGAADDLSAKGDNKEFTIKADGDISTIEIGDAYKSGGSLFAVASVRTKGSDGGEIILRRTRGDGDPGNTFDYAGPAPKANERRPPPRFALRRTLLDMYIQGGPFLHPIALLGLVTILLSANAIWVYRRSQQIPTAFVDQARELLAQGQIAKFEDLALKTKGLFPYVCRAMTASFDSSQEQDIRSRAEVAAAGQINRLRLPVRALNLIAAAAPLLGLLGTIIGMVIVFEGLANTSGAARATLLAAGIRVKLFSTATALMVAIPALFLYFFFNARLSALIADCEVLAEEFIHRVFVIKRKGKLPGGAESGIPGGGGGARPHPNPVTAELGRGADARTPDRTPGEEGGL